jgi:hypothetical protein
MNFGTGSRAVSTKAFEDDLSRVDMPMLARLIRRGCATLSPVMVDIFVLSDDKMVPRSVAPLGRADCPKIDKYDDSHR